jgi:hypothetical protein
MSMAIRSDAVTRAEAVRDRYSFAGAQKSNQSSFFGSHVVYCVVVWQAWESLQPFKPRYPICQVLHSKSRRRKLSPNCQSKPNSINRRKKKTLENLKGRFHHQLIAEQIGCYFLTGKRNNHVFIFAKFPPFPF